MSKTNIKIKVRLAWWVKIYLNSVALFAYATNQNPDMDKVSRVVVRGIKVKVEKT